MAGHPTLSKPILSLIRSHFPLVALVCVRLQKPFYWLPNHSTVWTVHTVEPARQLLLFFIAKPFNLNICEYNKGNSDTFFTFGLNSNCRAITFAICRPPKRKKRARKSSCATTVCGYYTFQASAYRLTSVGLDVWRSAGASNEHIEDETPAGRSEAPKESFAAVEKHQGANLGAEKDINSV